MKCSYCQSAAQQLKRLAGALRIALSGGIGANDSDMRLFWSSRSPYARKVMVSAHELGLAEAIECIPTAVSLRSPAPDPANPNPLGQIPTLVLEDGRVLYDSVVICDYLALLGTGADFIPGGAARHEALRWQSLGDSITDHLIHRFMERNRKVDGVDSEYARAYRRRVEQVLDRMEGDDPFDVRDPVHIGHVAIACALSYIDFRFSHDDWRQSRKALAAWYEWFSRRPSMVATQFSDAT